MMENTKDKIFVVVVFILCLFAHESVAKSTTQQRGSPSSRPSSPSSRPSSSPSHRPAPSPSHRPSPTATFRPVPARTSKPAASRTLRPVTYRPLPLPTYKPSLATRLPFSTNRYTTPRYRATPAAATHKHSAPTLWPRPPPTTPRWGGRPATRPTYPMTAPPSPWATRSPQSAHYPSADIPPSRHGGGLQYPYPTMQTGRPQWSSGSPAPWYGQSSGGGWGDAHDGNQWSNKGRGPNAYGYGTDGYGGGYNTGKKSKTSVIVDKLKIALKNPSTQRALKNLLTKAFSSKKKPAHSNQRYGAMPVIYGANNRPYYISDQYGAYQPGHYDTGDNTWNTGGDTWTTGTENSFSDGSEQPAVGVPAAGGVTRCVYDVPAGEASAFGNGSVQIRQVVFECSSATEICCGLDCCPAADFTQLNAFINSTLAKSHANLSSAERWNLTETLLATLEQQANGTANYTDTVTIGGVNFNITELASSIGGAEDTRVNTIPVTVDRIVARDDEAPPIGVTVDREVPRD